MPRPRLIDPATSASAEDVRDAYARVRARTLELAAPLSDEDACVQSMPDASPAKWHLAHTTWFFETFVLEPRPGYRPFNPAYRVLFNSYYNGIGEQHPRPQRGLLTRPSLAEVRAFRAHVDAAMDEVLRSGTKAVRELVVLGLNHEQQHQELLLTDVKHLLSMNPLRPAYQRAAAPAEAAVSPLEWQTYEGGLSRIGHAGSGFAFDNEAPRHRVLLERYRLATRLTTNGEYLAFIADGGYDKPALWLSDGWNWKREQQLSRPIYWLEEHGAWHEFTLSGVRPLDPDAPAVHLSYYEADAYARWADARLPTEAEWEHAAAQCGAEGHFADDGMLHPRRAHGEGMQQMLGDAWEWTQSSYAPYPGYRNADGAIGEYNGKFMVNQYVLRGGSCATPRGHVRATYRNFFPASARWQFSGVRLARD
jgi:ergothioneine biosynthesis protein EgtB